MKPYLSCPRTVMIAVGMLLLGAGVVPSAWAQATLSVDEAVTMALQNDPGVQSSSWDWLSASANAEAAKWRMLPSLSFSAGYQRLSDLGTESLQIGPVSATLPASLDNYFAFAVNTQYQVFAGFRIREATTLAQLQAESKLVGIEMVKRALMFEVRRAYWEAVRATSNCQTLQVNLQLAKAGSQFTSQQVAQGIATQADQLAAEGRLNQATLDFGDAVSLQNRAYLTLGSLIGNDSVALNLSPQPADASPPFNLTSKPGDPAEAGLGQSLDEQDLLSKALDQRPETRISSLSIQMAQHAVKQAQASLYPSVTLTGNYTYADPNQRVAFQTDPTIFTGTWALGIQLSYDVGGLETNLATVKAQDQALKKAQADADRQHNTVTLDVRTCINSLAQARRDVSLTQAAVDQANEDLRVAQERLANGTANSLEVLTAQFEVLRAGFAVANREIDVQIASADLARAIALDAIK